MNASIFLPAAAVFVATAIASDVCFGRLLEREYLSARADWERDGHPISWTWKPPERSQVTDTSFAIFRSVRWRWLVSSPAWMLRDRTASSLHTWHRILSLVALGAWVVMMLFVFVHPRPR